VIKPATFLRSLTGVPLVAGTWIALAWLAGSLASDVAGTSDHLGRGRWEALLRGPLDERLLQSALVMLAATVLGALLRATSARSAGRLRVRGWLALGLALLALLTLLGARAGHHAALRRALAGRPHVVLISLDTLRADHLGCYGYGRDTSPRLDALAARGVRFDSAWSQATSTLASHLSLFTSLYPPEFGIVCDDGVNFVQNTTRLKLAERVVTLAEALQAAGYDTAAFAGGGLLSDNYGFDQGFDTFWHASQPSESTLAVSLPGLTAWLDDWRTRRPPGSRFFAFLHTYDVHDPYRAPDPFKTRFSARKAERFLKENGYPPTATDLELHMPDPEPAELQEIVAFYDNQIPYADQEVGALERYLREHGLWEDTLVIVLSDHGEEFQDHGGWGHGGTVFRELARVPLILRFPGDARAGSVVRAPVQLLDVAPTVLDALDLPIPRDWRGLSLLPLLGDEAGAGGADPGPGRLIYSEIANEKRGVRGVRQGRWLLVVDGEHDRRALFDAEADPAERHDVAGEHPDVAARLHAELERLMGELSATRSELSAVPMDEGDLSLIDVEQDLMRALGYVR
jgi:arylsulfatase A-like enzyme